MIEIKTDPTLREIRLFGLLWLLFFGALAALVVWKPVGLAAAALFMTAAWLVSMLFNRDDRRVQLLGLLLPALFGSSWGAVRAGLPAAGVAAALGTVGLAGALAILASPRVGRTFYVGWMYAALPVGWTVSHVVLGVVYYGVLTPIGLLLRATGRDPMQRAFDREGRSYWIRRKPGRGPESYFRQF